MDSNDVDRLIAQIQASTDKICAAILTASVISRDELPEGLGGPFDLRAKIKIEKFLKVLKEQDA